MVVPPCPCDVAQRKKILTGGGQSSASGTRLVNRRLVNVNKLEVGSYTWLQPDDRQIVEEDLGVGLGDFVDVWIPSGAFQEQTANVDACSVDFENTQLLQNFAILKN